MKPYLTYIPSLKFIQQSTDNQTSLSADKEWTYSKKKKLIKYAVILENVSELKPSLPGYAVPASFFHDLVAKFSWIFEEGLPEAVRVSLHK